MRIREYEDGKVLAVCSYKISPRCEDRCKDKEAIAWKAARKGIKKISHGCCEKCEAILNAELDKEDNLKQ